MLPSASLCLIREVTSSMQFMSPQKVNISGQCLFHKAFPEGLGMEREPEGKGKQRASLTFG